jgi:hypothetical protein
MASIVAQVSDRFPVGTSVGAYPANSQVPGAGASGSAIASATVAANGTVTITNAGIVDHTPYILYAAVNGQHRHMRATSSSSNFTAPLGWRPKLKARREAIGTTLPGAP